MLTSMDKKRSLFPPDGRLRQRDYILWQLLLTLVGTIFFLLAFSSIPGVIFLIIGLSLFEIYLSARRLQDCEISGWFSLLMIIPTVNGIGVLLLCVYPGTKGINKFGSDPREKPQQV